MYFERIYKYSFAFQQQAVRISRIWVSKCGSVFYELKFIAESNG